MLEWNTCENVWNGVKCIRQTRYPGGKTCALCQLRKARAKDPELTKKRRRAQYEAKLEHAKATSRAYYAAHKEERKLACAVWRIQNPDKVKKYYDEVYRPKRQAAKQKPV